jgi:hypothetical protein
LQNPDPNVNNVSLFGIFNIFSFQWCNIYIELPAGIISHERTFSRFLLKCRA